MIYREAQQKAWHVHFPARKLKGVQGSHRDPLLFLDLSSRVGKSLPERVGRGHTRRFISLITLCLLLFQIPPPLPPIPAPWISTCSQTQRLAAQPCLSRTPEPLNTSTAAKDRTTAVSARLKMQERPRRVLVGGSGWPVACRSRLRCSRGHAELPLGLRASTVPQRPGRPSKQGEGIGVCIAMTAIRKARAASWRWGCLAPAAGSHC